MSGWAEALRARRWSIGLGLLIGGLGLLFALAGAPLDEVIDGVRAADPGWVALTGLTFLVQQALRAWRQVLLLQGRYPRFGLRSSLSVLCISFFFINSLPARLGELARPLLLLEREGVPFGAGFALMVVERAVDLCAMCLMLGALVWIAPVPEAGFQVGGAAVPLQQLARGAVGLTLPLVVGGLTIALLWGAPIWRAISDRLPAEAPGLRGRLLRAARSMGGDFTAATTALASPSRIAGVLALTAATWGTTALMYPMLARAFGIEGFIGLREGWGLLGVAMASLALPAAPGFAGTYEAFLIGGLRLFGVAGPAAAPGSALSLDAVALAYALTMHWWVHLVQSASALWFLIRDRIDPLRLLAALGEALGKPPAP